jgi:hypothetical protein
MILWFPQHVPKAVVFKYLESFDPGTFQQILQDRIHSRYPSFTQTRIFVDENLQEIDTQCAICFEQGDFQLTCGHIFHKRCIKKWKQRQHSCPLCRASI